MLFDILKYVQNAFQIKMHMHPGAETPYPLTDGLFGISV
jgi:hypothetical protein